MYSKLARTGSPVKICKLTPLIISEHLNDTAFPYYLELRPGKNFKQSLDSPKRYLNDNL